MHAIWMVHNAPKMPQNRILMHEEAIPEGQIFQGMHACPQTHLISEAPYHGRESNIIIIIINFINIIMVLNIL